MRTWPTAWGRMGAVRGWMWMPTDLAALGTGMIVGIVLGRTIGLALDTKSVLINSVYGSRIG